MTEEKKAKSLSVKRTGEFHINKCTVEERNLNTTQQGV
jgi:hypothetical protein